MTRPLAFLCVFFIMGLFAGCAVFPKKDEPPPLPPIEETKPPIKLKADYFKEFPWPDLPKPSKDGNDPDTRTYTVKEGDTFDSIAEKEMGDPAMGQKLAAFNDLSDTRPPVGEKIVIPNPIIGLDTSLVVKRKGDKEFGSPEPFETDLKKGDQYKIRFESNVNGNLYVFREGPKGVDVLYPAAAKTPRRAGRKPAEPVMRDTGKVKAHEPILVPTAGSATPDPKRSGDRLFVFLSLKEIPELEDLKGKTKIRADEINDVMHRVNAGDIVTDRNVRVIRISDPQQVLGFTINLNY